MSWIDDELCHLLREKERVARRLIELGHHPANFSDRHRLSPHGVRFLFTLVDAGFDDSEVGAIMGITANRVTSRRRRR